MLDEQYQINSHSIHVETKLDLKFSSTSHYINPTRLTRFNNISKNFFAVALTQATFKYDTNLYKYFPNKLNGIFKWWLILFNHHFLIKKSLFPINKSNVNCIVLAKIYFHPCICFALFDPYYFRFLHFDFRNLIFIFQSLNIERKERKSLGKRERGFD
jgi:hypothetical protein